MKEIPLTLGKFALVDDEDYALLNQYKWKTNISRRTFYAVRMFTVSKGKRRTVSMHTLLCNTPAGLSVDHIDGNGLNNQKSNLRIATNRMNQQNRHVGDSSKYPGVSFNKAIKKWHAYITINKIRTHLGYFKDEFTAFKTYVVANVVLLPYEVAE